MNTILRPSLALLLVGSPAVTATAAPQAPGPYFESEPRRLGEAYLEGRGETFGRALHGEFTGDMRPDVVQMVGSTPTLFYGPGLYHAVLGVPVVATAMTVLDGGTRDGRDALVVATAHGLRRCVANAGTNAWDVTGLGSGAFAGALRLAAGDVNGDGKQDLVALDGAGLELRFLFDPGGTASEATLALPAQTTDFVLLDWEAGGALEFGLVTEAGLRVERFDGTTAFSHGLGRSGDLLVVLPGDGAGDRLVATARAGGNEAWLVVADALTGAEAPVALGAIDVVGIAVGDLDLDGYSDLVVSHRAADELWLLRQQVGSGASFTLAAPGFSALATGSVPGPAPTNSAWPVLTDLDQDGDADLSFAVQTDEWISIYRGRSLSHLDQQPVVSGQSYTWDTVSDTGTLILQIEEPQAPLGNATHLECVVWRQSAADAPVERVAILARTAALAPSWPQSLTLTVDEDLGAVATRDIEIRLAAHSGGDVMTVGPTYVGGFATSNSALALLLDLFGSPLADIVPLDLFGLPVSATNLSDVGTGVVPLGEVPCFADDELPKPK